MGAQSCQMLGCAAEGTPAARRRPCGHDEAPVVVCRDALDAPTSRKASPCTVCGERNRIRLEPLD